MKLPTAVLTGMLVREGLLPKQENPWEALAEQTDAEPDACRELGALLGRGDAESQAAAVELIRSGLALRAEQAAEDARVKGKLYTTLGVLGGMLAAILCG